MPEDHQTKYRGFLITWQTPKPVGTVYPAQISTQNLELRTRLGVDAYQTSQVSFEDAIEMAKATIDTLLDDGGLNENAY